METRLDLRERKLERRERFCGVEDWVGVYGVGDSQSEIEIIWCS